MPAKVDENVCIGCGTCQASCPVGAINLSEDSGYAEVDQPTCISCGACEGSCPVGAIKLDD